jgi:NADH-quinone oxidoreductase subunit A
MPYELLLATSLLVVITLAIVALFLFTQYLGPQNKSNVVKNEVYESGVTAPIASGKHSYNIKFYLVAILFVIFDVEVIFMLPWAVNLRELGWFGFFEMTLFMAILVAGLVYIYNKKALSWD